MDALCIPFGHPFAHGHQVCAARADHKGLSSPARQGSKPYPLIGHAHGSKSAPDIA